MYVSLLLMSPLLFKYIKLSVTHRLMLHATDQRAVNLNLSSDVDAVFLTNLSKTVLDFCKKTKSICIKKENLCV